MKPFLVFALRMLRSRAGAVSLLEALPGVLLAASARWIAGKVGVELSTQEEQAAYMAGPLVSSYIAGRIREVYRDIRAWVNRPGPTPPDAYGASHDDARK